MRDDLFLFDTEVAKVAEFAEERLRRAYRRGAKTQGNAKKLYWIHGDQNNIVRSASVDH